MIMALKIYFNKLTVHKLDVKTEMAATSNIVAGGRATLKEGFLEYLDRYA